MTTTDSGWDVTSGAGLTALGLAAARTVESGRSDRLIDDPLAAAFVHAVDSPVLFPMSWPASGTPSSDQEALFLHGSRYIGVRTRFYDDEVMAAVADGVRQVVLLAAGLDTRAYRLGLATDVHLFELDQPGVVEFKDGVLAESAPPPACARQSVGVDLRDDWPAALLAAGFDPRRPAVWIAEGLLAYLDGAGQRTLLARVHELSAAGSRFAADRLVPDDARREVERLSQRSGMDMSALLHTDSGLSPSAALADLGWDVGELPVTAVAEQYGRDLADPFSASPGDAAPPWLDTAFLRAIRQQ